MEAFYKAYCNLGYIYAGKGDDDRAIDFFRKAIDLNRTDYEPHYCLSTIYMKRGRFKEALFEYEQALRFGLNE